MVGDEICDTFAPNPFKLAILLQKENCKNCGRPWTDHQDVSSEDQVGGFLKAIKNAADDWGKLQQLKHTGDHEVWLPDEFRDALTTTEVPDSETDGSDVEFQMFTPSSFCTATVDAEETVAERQIKVTNLIDFGECNEPQGYESSPSELWNSTATCEEEVHNGRADHGGVNLNQSSNESLQEQIHSLKQMLQDTVQEKAVQISILRDDLREKDKVISDLRRRHADSESSLCEMRDQIWSLQSELAQAELTSGSKDAVGNRLSIKQMGDLCLYMRDRFVKEMLDCPSMEKAPGTGGSDMSSEGVDVARELQRLCDAASAVGAMLRGGTSAAAVSLELRGATEEKTAEVHAEQAKAAQDESDMQFPESEQQARDVDGEQERYLPKFLNGVPVLVMEAPNLYRVDNGQLRAQSAGLGYRFSRSMTDKDASNTAKWGSLVRGVDAGDSWIRCRIQDWISADSSRRSTHRSSNISQDDWLDFGDLHHEAAQSDFRQRGSQCDRQHVLKNFGAFWNYLKDLDDR